MNIFDLGYVMTRGVKNIGKGRISYEVFESQFPAEVKGEVAPQNMISVYTATKILSGAISQMDIQITKDNKDYKAFSKYYELKYRMNSIQNNQSFWSTIEYHRNVYGNAFVDIRNNRNEIIHPALISDYDFKGAGSSLRFKIAWSSESAILQDKRNDKKQDEWIANKDVLHFKGMSVDGVFGLPPVSAASQAMDIMDKASNTISSFYENQALSPMSLESTIDNAITARLNKEELEVFNKKYSGTYAAGKTLQLPPNTKLTPLAIQFRDAELVATMKYTREELFAMYGIPTFLYASTSDLQGDIEQQSLNFKTFTILPITRVYEEELEYKLFSKNERMNDAHIDLNMDSLLEADLQTKAVAYRGLVTAGMITLSAGSEAMGFGPIEHENGNKHYLQVQNIGIEDIGSDTSTMSVNKNKKVDIDE